MDGPNGRGGLWLLADLSLNIWALSIVKWLGLGFPPAQLVFLRAAMGLAMLAPLIWRRRAAFAGLADLRLHALRVGLSAVALTSSFYAIARVPFALFTAIGFTRPIVTMILALIFLREAVPRRRWIAAVIGLVGVVIAVGPGGTAFTWGLPALFLTVLAGTGAIIVTRRLNDAPAIVMMTFYTAGLTALAAVPALIDWSPVAPDEWPPLLAIGVFAQSAQFCFLMAHRNAEASFLSVLSYASLLMSAGVGFVVFGEVPTLPFALGAALIVGATLWSSRPEATRPRV